MLVGKKYLSKLASRSNEAVGSSVSSFAKRQMEKMGWKEGQGLGKNEQGIVKHIRVQKREENAGIGAEDAARENFNDQWWNNVYNTAASEITGKKVTKIPTDEELFIACGGRRLCSQGGAHSALKTKTAKGKLARADCGEGSGIAGKQLGKAKKSEKSAKKKKRKRKKEEIMDLEEKTSKRRRTECMDSTETEEPSKKKKIKKRTSMKNKDKKKHKGKKSKSKSKSKSA